MKQRTLNQKCRVVQGFLLPHVSHPKYRVSTDNPTQPYTHYLNEPTRSIKNEQNHRTIN
jgi:hypothetical protein